MGYIQLLAKGVQDFNLVGNPQISFYKIVYRRYTNFSMETKELKVTGNIISENSNVTLECEIKRNADLLSNLYFTFELPDIYSGCYPDNHKGTYQLPYEFRWIENIGTNIINNAKIMLNETTLNSYSGEFLQVLSELKYDDSKKKIYNEMTGNVPELYNPGLYNEDRFINKKSNFRAIIHDDNNTLNKNPTKIDNIPGSLCLYSDGAKCTSIDIHSDGIFYTDGIKIKNDPNYNKLNCDFTLLHSTYPHVIESSTKQHTHFNISHDIKRALIIQQNDTNFTASSDFIPSIRKRKIKVPLNFCFSKTTGIALPLVALPYTQVNVEIILKNIKELYTILDYIPNQQVVRCKPTTINIDRFIGLSPFNIKPKIEAEYIFLDNDERKRFAAGSHEYLIEDMQVHKIKGISSTQDHSILFSNPVKELIIVSQRDDMSRINNWNNYTNWPIENVAPYGYRYNNIENMYHDGTDYIFYNRLGVEGTTDADKNFKLKYFDENIVKNIRLLFNGQSRVESKDAEYYNYIQPYQHYKRKIKKGIHVYSFSLNPDEFQPSGACNFSKIDNFKINIDLGIENNVKEIPNNGNNPYFSYNFTVYAINYNILKITSGVAAKQYVS